MASTSPPHRRPGPKAYLLIALFAFALVLLPFLFWYQTWFGRKLSDAEIGQYFADAGKPRHAQQALVQLGERLSRGRDVSCWYPDVLRQAASPSLEIRQTAAWIMGQDRSYAPFHAALAKLAADPDPMVRRNAALALAGFGDPAARPELLRMLEPFEIVSPASGVLNYRLKLGDYVNPGTLVAHVSATEVRAAAPGEVRSLERKNGAAVRTGDPLAGLAPDKDHVWEALRALYIVGRPDDLERVERFAHGASGIPDKTRLQASYTAQAIKSRQTTP